MMLRLMRTKYRILTDLIYGFHCKGFRLPKRINVMPRYEEVKVIEKVVTKTEQGEVTVNLNICLTLKVDQNNISVMKTSVEDVKDDKVKMEIPDFGETQLINFSNDVLR